MVRWLRGHCPPDTGFEIRALVVWGRARYLSVTEAPHNTDFHTWMGKKHFCFFQTAETGNRTPSSGVKGSGANHYPRAPPSLRKESYVFILYNVCLSVCSCVCVFRYYDYLERHERIYMKLQPSVCSPEEPIQYIFGMIRITIQNPHLDPDSTNLHYTFSRGVSLWPKGNTVILAGLRVSDGLSSLYQILRVFS